MDNVDEIRNIRTYNGACNGEINLLVEFCVCFVYSMRIFSLLQNLAFFFLIFTLIFYYVLYCCF